MRTTIRHRDRKEWSLDNGDVWGAYRVGPRRWVGYIHHNGQRQELLKIYDSPDAVRKMAIAEEAQQLELF